MPDSNRWGEEETLRPGRGPEQGPINLNVDDLAAQLVSIAKAEFENLGRAGGMIVVLSGLVASTVAFLFLKRNSSGGEGSTKKRRSLED